MIPPPIPDMPSEIPPGPGHDHLVSVAVSDNVPVRDVLVELSREANVNLELDPRVSGGVIFSAHNQPFDVVLCHIPAFRPRAASGGDTFLE